MNSILVSYFSASGVTKEIASFIATKKGADLFEIEPTTKYSAEDLDWTNKNSRSTIEMNDKSFRPPIKRKAENIDNYNTIIIGFPVWWYTAPPIINTFIEENDLSNKKIYVFVTSGGSSSEGSFNDLKNTYPDLNFISSRRFNKSITLEEINDWLSN